MNFETQSSLKIFWSFKKLFFYAFVIAKTWKWWNLGIKWCSNCCNCIIMPTRSVYYIQIKYQISDIFLRMQSFLRCHYWFAFHEKKKQPSYTYVKAQAQIDSPDHEIKSRKKVQFCVTSFAFLKKSSRANFESCFFFI